MGIRATVELVAFRNVVLLGSFALWPVLPTSDYYDPTDSSHPSSDDRYPPGGRSLTFMWMDSAR